MICFQDLFNVNDSVYKKLIEHYLGLIMGKTFPIIVIAVAIIGFSSSAYFFSESEKRYSDAFLVAISCSFGSHGEKGVFWVVMFLYTGNCGYVLIVEFRLYSSLSLLSLSLYYRTELVSNGKNVCCSSIQSQRNWICIVSYPRHRNSFLTISISFHYLHIAV